MNLHEAIRKTIVNSLIETTPPRVVIEAQLEVIQEQAAQLAAQATRLREQAEEIARRLRRE